MKEFMFLFRNTESAVASLSPEEMQANMQEWGKWMSDLGTTGNFVAGQPLQKEGKVVKDAGSLVTDGPFTEASEVVGGYLIVKANDLDHATELSKGCPIYKSGGNTEVREIMEMS